MTKVYSITAKLSACSNLTLDFQKCRGSPIEFVFGRIWHPFPLCCLCALAKGLKLKCFYLQEKTSLHLQSSREKLSKHLVEDCTQTLDNTNLLPVARTFRTFHKTSLKKNVQFVAFTDTLRVLHTRSAAALYVHLYLFGVKWRTPTKKLR